MAPLLIPPTTEASTSQRRLCSLPSDITAMDVGEEASNESALHFIHVKNA